MNIVLPVFTATPDLIRGPASSGDARGQAGSPGQARGDVSRMSDMAGLDEYNRKRDFRRTAEPAGKVDQARTAIASSSRSTMRPGFTMTSGLEVDGVLKSWAVTRGPSLDPDDKSS